MEEASANGNRNWMRFANETYISEAGWYFKTLAVQEIGELREGVNFINVKRSNFSYERTFWQLLLRTCM